MKGALVRAYAMLLQANSSRFNSCWDMSPCKRLRGILAANNGSRMQLTTALGSSRNLEYRNRTRRAESRLSVEMLLPNFDVQLASKMPGLGVVFGGWRTVKGN